METLKQAFEQKYPKYATRILTAYEKTNGCDASWKNITKPKLSMFVADLQKTIAKSSARTYCAMFKAVLNLYSEEIDLPKGYEDILSIKKDASQNTWLTDEEIEKIILYNPTEKAERIVKNQFVLGALTGARHSDYIKFNRENIVSERLAYVSQKTKSMTEIPLAPAAKRIIAENEDFEIIGVEFSTTYFNEVLREICRKVGITEKTKLYQAGEYHNGEKYEFIGSHTARRSFATNLYLRGADLYLISKLMGHESITQTEGYICCGIREIPQNVVDYFGRFK